MYSSEQTGLTAGYGIGCLHWESPGKFYPQGRTQPEVKKYLHLLLLGGQPSPSPFSLACQEGLQEKTGLLQQRREGQGLAAGIRRRAILFALLHHCWKKTRETSSGFYAWVDMKGTLQNLGGAPKESKSFILLRAGFVFILFLLADLGACKSACNGARSPRMS